MKQGDLKGIFRAMQTLFKDAGNKAILYDLALKQTVR